MNKKLVNHIHFVVDVSGSMTHHMNKMNELASKLSSSLTLAEAAGQETLISVSKFSTRRIGYNDVPFVELIANDVPARGFIMPQFRTEGGTPLIDAICKTLRDSIIKDALCQKSLVEDHTFLFYFLTDGEELHSKEFTAYDVRTMIPQLSDSFTLSVMVPDQRAVHFCKNLGFPAGNIEVWNTSATNAMEVVGETMSSAYANYTTSRSMGLRSSSAVFHVNAAAVSVPFAQANLPEVSGNLIKCDTGGEIRKFVENHTGKTYKLGTAFYELTKTETVQAKKQLIIMENKLDGKKFGGPEVRRVLGLPMGTEIKVRPGDHGQWRVFVQSTSINRKLMVGTWLYLTA